MSRNYEPLKCEYCKKDVLSSEEGGLLVHIEHAETGELDDVYISCNSECYDSLKELRSGDMELDRWRDLEELKNPILFLEYVVELMEELNNGRRYEDKHFEKVKEVVLRTAQYIIRDITPEEKDEAIRYNMERIKI